MKKIFISNIKIEKVRHLKNLKIEISDEEKKHLILTGKNGSGKTSLLNSIADFLNSITKSNDPMDTMRYLELDKKNLLHAVDKSEDSIQVKEIEKRIESYEKRIKDSTGGIMLEMNFPLADIRSAFEKGEFVVAYYKAERIFKAHVPKHVEKIELKNDYAIQETPREDFIKYLLDLKMTQALAVSNGKKEKAEKIGHWFDDFQDLLRKIFENDSVKLEFDEETFKFQILMDGREPFDFNTLSSGYAAILDIMLDLIIRMEKQTNRVFDFSVPGIVLIDEIDTHLHLALQKKILELLITFFPNIQFIVSTHSPFIVNSLDNAVIYDLEKRLLVKDGLSDVPYSGIVEGYFNTDLMSETLREKYDRYRILVQKQELTDEDFDEIADLEMYLNEIPDYLALNITTEYQRLKMELRNREDI